MRKLPSQLRPGQLGRAKKAMEVAIKALGLTEERTPDLEGDGYSNGHLVYDTWICPNCETHYEMEYEEHDHCPNCGSAAIANPYRKGHEIYPYCPWCGQKLKEEKDEQTE